MEQYISKSALVAEIEKRIEALIDKKKKLHIKAWNWSIDTEIKDYKSILSFIDSLEVKEDNLLTEKKIEKELAEIYINIFDKKFGNKLPK